MGPDPTLESGPQEHECLETGEDVVISDANQEPEQLRDCLKEQDKELTKINLAKEEKEAHPTFYQCYYVC